MQTYYNYIKLFYKDISNTTFKGISARKILALRFYAKKFNNYFNYNDVDCPKYKRYKNIISEIKISKNKLNLTTEAEKYILLMFSVDPTFETFKIYGECNTIKEIHNKMIQTFGIHDPYLISIEKNFIKLFFSEKKKNEIYEEIENRIYK